MISFRELVEDASRRLANEKVPNIDEALVLINQVFCAYDYSPLRSKDVEAILLRDEEVFIVLTYQSACEDYTFPEFILDAVDIKLTAKLHRVTQLVEADIEKIAKLQQEIEITHGHLAKHLRELTHLSKNIKIC